MAIKQIVTYSKAGAGFTDIQEALDSINAVAASGDPTRNMQVRRDNGEFEATVSFDVASQTITVTRNWIELYYNEHKASQTRVDTKAVLQEAGWTMLETVETV